jgi:predicted nucleic acid-binding Zn ribbon protein
LISYAKCKNISTHILPIKGNRDIKSFNYTIKILNSEKKRRYEFIYIFFLFFLIYLIALDGVVLTFLVVP